MSSEHLQIERSGSIAIVTIQRPERRNALHGPLWADLRETFAGLHSDPPRVLIVTGADDHFCAGMDLQPENPLFTRLMPAITNSNREEVLQIIYDLKATFDHVASMPCVVIAAIEGACIGSGLELALACDLRVAATSSVFAMPEPLLGMVADLGGTVRLTRLLGAERATDLLLTGRRIGLVEALNWGLVSRECADGEALASAKSWAEELRRSSPVAAAKTLEVVRSAHEGTMDEALERETQAGADAVLAGDLVEGVTAFVQKRTPSWLQ